MKKILTIILTCFLSLSLAGCSASKNNDDILAFFNALDNTLNLKSAQINGTLAMKDSKLNIDAQILQKDELQVSSSIGLVAGKNVQNNFLNFYIKDGKTYLNSMGTKTQSTVDKIGLKKNSKLNAYNPFLDLTDDQLCELFDSSKKENDTYKGLRSIFLCFGIYLALIILALPATAMAFCIKLIRVAVILSIAKILVGMISPTSKLMKKVKGNEKLQENQKLIQTGTKLLKVLIYIVAGFMIISEFGYDLNGIITGLGLGSVVIALAAQELVSNLLSGMAIASEKPFEIGDWVTIGDISGTIVDIKFRSIKIKTVENTTVTIQNTKILSEAIINSATINARRIEMTLRLPLDTSSEKTEELMKSIRNILESMQEINKNTIQINVTEIGAEAIIIKVFLYTNIVDYDKFLTFSTKLNLTIMKLLEDKRIKLANPSADIYFSRK